MSRIWVKLGALMALLASTLVLLAAPERARACEVFTGLYLATEDTGCTYPEYRWSNFHTRPVTVVLGVQEGITPLVGRPGSITFAPKWFQFNQESFGGLAAPNPVRTLVLDPGTKLSDLTIYTSPFLNVPFNEADAAPRFTLILSVKLGSADSAYVLLPLTVTLYNDKLEENCAGLVLAREASVGDNPICSFSYSKESKAANGVAISSALTNFSVFIDTKERTDLTLLRRGNSNQFSLAYKQGATISKGARTVTVYRGLGREGLLLKEHVVTLTAAQAVHSGGSGSCLFREFNPGEKTVVAIQGGSTVTSVITSTFSFARPVGDRIETGVTLIRATVVSIRGGTTTTVTNSYATECKGSIQLAVGEGATSYVTVAWPADLTLRSSMAGAFRLSEEDNTLHKDLSAGDHSFTLVINHQATLNAQSKALHTVAMPLSVHRVVGSGSSRRTLFNAPGHISMTVSLANRIPAPARFPLGQFRAVKDQDFALNIPKFWFNDTQGTSLSYSASVISGPSNDANVNGWLNQGGAYLAGRPSATGTYVYGVRASDGGSEIKIRNGASTTVTFSDPLTVTIEVRDDSNLEPFSNVLEGRQSIVLAENDSLTLLDINFRGTRNPSPSSAVISVAKAGNANHASKVVGFTFRRRAEILNGDSTPFTIRQNLLRRDSSTPSNGNSDYYVMYVRGQSSGQCPQGGEVSNRYEGDVYNNLYFCIRNGQIVMAAGSTITLDYETKSAYTLTIKTYKANNNDFNGLGTITVSVTNLNDHPHTLSIGGGALPINEGTLSAGQTVFTGYRMRIVDRDGAAFAHSVSFSQPGFQLRSDRIEVVGPVTLDYERGDGLLRVNVSDAAAYDYGGNKRSTVAVLTLDLRDVRENEPVVAVKGYQDAVAIHVNTEFALDLNQAFIAGGDTLTFTPSSTPALSGLAVANGVMRVTPTTARDYVIAVVAASTVSPPSSATMSFTLHVRPATVSLAGQVPNVSIGSLTGLIAPSVAYAEPNYLHARDSVKYTNLTPLRDSLEVVSITLSKRVIEVVTERGNNLQTVSRTITVTKVTVVGISGFEYNQQLIQVLDERIGIDFSNRRRIGSDQWIRGFFIKPGSSFSLNEFTRINVGGSNPQQKKLITIVLNSTIRFSSIKNRAAQSLLADGFTVDATLAQTPRRAYAVLTLNTQPGIGLEGEQVALPYPGSGVVDTGLTLVAAAPAGNVVFSVNIDAIKLTSTVAATIRRQAVRLDSRAAALATSQFSTTPCGGYILPVTARVETGGSPSTSSNLLAFTLRFNHNLVDGKPNLVGQGAAVVATSSVPAAFDTGYELNCAAPGLEATFNPDLFELAAGTGQRRAIMLKRQADINSYRNRGVLTATITYKQASDKDAYTAVMEMPVVASLAPPPLRAWTYRAPLLEVGERFVVELSRLFDGGGNNIAYSSSFRPWSADGRTLGSANSNLQGTFANGLFTFSPSTSGHYQVAIVARAGNASATSSFNLIVAPASAATSTLRATPPSLEVKKAPRIVLEPGVKATANIYIHQPADFEYANASPFLRKSYFEVTMSHHPGTSWSWSTILLIPKERYNEQIVRVLDDRFGVDSSSASTANGKQIIPGVYVKPGASFNSSPVRLTMQINRGVDIDSLLDPTLQSLARLFPQIQMSGDTQVAGAYLSNIRFGYATVTIMEVAGAPSVSITGQQVSIDASNTTGDFDSGLNVEAETGLGDDATLAYTFAPDVFKIADLRTTSKTNDLLVDRAKLANATLTQVPAGPCGNFQLNGNVHVEDKDDVSSPTVSFSITVFAAALITSDDPKFANTPRPVPEGSIEGTTLSAPFNTGMSFTCAGDNFRAEFSNSSVFEIINGSTTDQRLIMLKQGTEVNYEHGKANVITSRVTYSNRNTNPMTATVTITVTEAIPVLATTGYQPTVSLLLEIPATIALEALFSGGYNGFEGNARTYSGSVDPAVASLTFDGADMTFTPTSVTIHKFTVIATERIGTATATFSISVRGEVPLVERIATDAGLEVARSSSAHLLRGIAARADRGPRGGNAFAPAADPSAAEQFGQMLLNKRSELEEGDIDLREFITGQSFSMPLSARGEGFGSGLGVWGQAHAFQIKRDATDYSYDGPLFSGMLGFDMTTGDALYGIAVGYHSGELEQEKRGDDKAHIFENRINTVAPYLALGFGNNSLLGMAGAGVGSIKIKDQAGDQEVLQETDTELVFYSLGYSYYLGDDRFGVKFKSAIIGNELVTKGDEVTAYPESEAKNLQLRLGLEMAGHFDVGAAGRLSPSLELAGLSDSYEIFIDDGYPNAALEYESDERYTGYEAILKFEYDSGHRLRLALDASVMGVPSNDYISYGGGLGLIFAAAPGSLGLGFDVTPQYGNLSSGAIYEMESLRDFSRVDRDYSLSATSSVGYGFALPGRVLQPYLSHQLQGERSDHILGVRLYDRGQQRWQLQYAPSDDDALMLEYRLGD